MAQIRGAVLDVDGTLVDSNDAHAEAWVEALARGGHEVPFERVRSLIGMGGDNLLPNAVDVKKESPEGKELNEWWKEIFESKYLPHLRSFPGTRELVKRMRQAGLEVAVASSSEQAMLKKLLQIARVDDLIQTETSSADASKSKPDPDIVEVALQRLKMPPDQAVMLGDSPYDVQACQRAGLPLVAVRCGGFTDEQLKGAIAIYDDPADLLAHYNGSPFSTRS